MNLTEKKRNRHYKGKFTKREESFKWKFFLFLFLGFSLFLFSLSYVGSFEIGAKGEEKYINATIDEFKIWNISLYGHDIYQHYVNNTFFLSSNITKQGRNYTVMLSSDDLFITSDLVNTTTLGINSFPTISNVFVTPLLPGSGENLICNFNVTESVDTGDAFEVNVTWYRIRGGSETAWSFDDENLIPIASAPGNNITGSIGNIESANTTQQDLWKCSINVKDNVNPDWTGWFNSSNVQVLERNITTIFTSGLGSGGQKVNVSNNNLISLNWSLRTRPYECDNNTVALYHFEDSAVDSCGVNDGVISDDVNFTSGYFGKAVQFDGNSDQINAGNDTSIQINGNLTVEAWVNHIYQDSTTAEGIVSARGNGNVAYEVFSRRNGELDFRVRAVEADYELNVGNVLPNNTWTHVVMVWDGTTIYGYQDGILLNTLSASGTLLLNNSYLCIGNVGGTTGCGSNIFKGSIDEIRISNATRDIEEFREYFRYGGFTQNTQALNRNVTFINLSWSESNLELQPDANTVLLLNFDEGSGLKTSDNSGLGNDGNLSGTPNWTEGKHDFGLKFDGLDDVVSVGDRPNLEGMDKLTVSVWIKTDNASINRGIVSKWNTGTVSYVLRTDQTNAGLIQFSTSADGTTNSESITKIDDGSWHYVTATYDGSNQKVYIDGNLEDTDAQTGSIANSEEFVCIGAFCNVDSTAINSFNGTLDEVRILNKSLTESEIIADYKKGLSEIYFQVRTSKDNVTYSNWTGNVDVPYYNVVNETLFYLTFDDVEFKSQGSKGLAGEDYRIYEGYDSETRALKVSGINQNDSGLAGYWKFDEIDDLQGAIDYSGLGNNGTLNGDPTLTEGIVGKAYNLDGDGDFLSIADTPLLDLGGDDFTMELWIKTDTSVTDKTRDLIQKQSGYGFSVTSAGKILFVTGGDDWTSTIDMPTDGAWHHFALIGSDSRNIRKIYQDGALQETNTDAFNVVDTATELKIGSGATDEFNGTFDEVAIWNRTLLGQEIRAHAFNPDFSETHYKKDGRFLKGIYVNESSILSYPISQSLDKDTLLLCRFDATSDSTGDYSCDTGEYGNFTYLDNLDDGDGLVSAYKLEGNASDLTGRNNGTEFGINFTSGYIGKGASFDGVDDYVSVANSNSLANITDNLTVELWTKNPGLAITETFISKYNHQTNQRAWQIITGGGGAGTSSNFGVIVSTDGTYSSSTVKDYESSIVAVDDSWHFLAFTFGSDNGLKLYVDGIEDTNPRKNEDASITKIHNSTAALLMGANFAGASPSSFFNGTIDEVAIYNRTLTQQEIASHAGSKYKKDGGKFGGAYFVANHSTLDFNQEKNIIRDFGALSFWVRPEVASDFGSDLVFFDTDGTGDNEFKIFFNASTDSFEFNTNNTNLLSSGTETFNALDWKFLTLTYDYSKDNYKLYVDGFLRASSGSSLDAPYYNKIYLGSDSTASQFANASLDEFKISKKILTDQEVYNEYLGNLNKTEGTLKFWLKPDWFGEENTSNYLFSARDQDDRLVLYLDFEDNSTLDLSGNNNDADQLGGIKCIVPGKIGSACEFDGSDDYLNIAYSNVFNFSTNPFSLEAWIKGSGTNTQILNRENLAGDNDIWALKFSSAGKLEFESSGSILGISSGLINDNIWHHIVATRDSSNTRIYIDGVLNNMTSEDNTNVNSDKPIVIGRRDTSANQYFNGLIDEVKIYNRSLTNEEAKQEHDNSKFSLFKAGNNFLYSRIGNGILKYNVTDWNSSWKQIGLAWDSRPYPDDPNLVSYWRFEGDATDSVFTNDGTLSGNVKNISGYVGSAYEFDGTDDFISANKNGLPTGSNPISYSLWARPGRNSGTDSRIIELGSQAAGKNFNLLVDSDEWRIDYWGQQYFNFRATNQDEWQHIVLAQNGTAHFFYINGVLNGTGLKALDIGSGGPNLQIGRYSGEGFNYNGSLDELAIYNKSLTPEEVRNIYSNIYLFVDGIEVANESSKQNLEELNLSSLMFIGSNARGGQQADSIFDDFAITNRKLSKEEIKPLGYTNSEGEIVNSSGNVSFVQWRAILTTASIENSGEIQNVTLTFNTAPLTPTLTFPSNDTWINTNNVNFRFNSTDIDGDLIEYYIFINDELNVSTTGTNLTVNLQDGNYNYSVKAGDLTENSTFSEVFNFSVDSILPVLEFVGPTEANGTNIVYNNTFINVSLTENNPGTGFVDFNKSLVLWLRFNNETGENSTFVRDWSSYGNNGTLINSKNISSTDSGKFGKALLFDGDNGYIDIPNSKSLNITETLSLEAWIKPRIGINQWIIDKDRENSYSLLVSNGVMEFYTNNSRIDSQAISINQWNHIVGTFNGTHRIIYSNGFALSTTTEASLAVSTQHVFIGGLTTAGNFNGTLDEIKIWNRVLSPEEINASFDLGRYPLAINITNIVHSNIIRDYNVYVQDFAGNVNNTQISFTNNPILDINFSWPLDGQNITRFSVFEVNSTVTCSGDYSCNNVFVYLNYNDSGSTPDTLLNTTLGEVPFYNSTGANPQIHNLNPGQAVQVNWTINATGLGDSFELGTFVNSTDSSIIENSSSINSTVRIPPALMIDFNWPLDNENITRFSVFEVNASVTCAGNSACDDVFIYLEYNGSGSTPDTLLNTTLGEVPFYNSTGANPQIHNLNPGQAVQVNWTINATLTGQYELGSFVNSSDTSIQENTTATNSTVHIPSDLIVDFNWPLDNENITRFSVFEVNASVTCAGNSACDDVFIYLEYNGSGSTPDTLLNTTLGEVPFYNSTGANPQIHNLNPGQAVQVNWTINVTSTGNYEIGAFVNSSDTRILENNSLTNSTITIPSELMVYLESPVNDTQLKPFETLDINSTIVCSGNVHCDSVSAFLRFNLTDKTPHTDVNTTVGGLPFYNVTGANPQIFTLNANQNVTVNWTINLTTSLAGKFEIGVFINSSHPIIQENTTAENFTLITNAAPENPINLGPINGTWAILYKNVTFNWTKSLDLNNDSINYSFEVAPAEDFSSLTFNITDLTATNYTINSTDMPEASGYWWRVRGFDGTLYSNYSNISFVDITYAKINISTPLNLAVFETRQSYDLQADEIDNEVWISSATFQVIGDTQETTTALTNNSGGESTSWTGTYSVPDITSRIVTLYVFGKNDSLGIEVNDSVNVKITRPFSVAIGNPVITTYITDPTNVEINNATNLTLIIDADVLVDKIITEISWPNGTIEQINPAISVDGNQSNSFIYYYNYTFTPSIVGEFNIKTNVTDLNFPTSSLIQENATIQVNNTILTNITGSSINNFSLKDTSSNRQFFFGPNITQLLVPGKYDLGIDVGSADKAHYDLFNVTLIGGNINACNFTEIDETLSTPTNTRAVDQWVVNCGGITPDNINITYNYSLRISSITQEDNLEFYKCGSQSSCTWEQLTSSLETSLDLVKANTTNFSVFMVAEDTAPEPSSSGGGGGGASGGGGGGASTERLISLDIISPAPLSLFTNDTIIAPLFIKNNGDIVLNGIKLTAESNSTGLDLELTEDSIDTLFLGQEVSSDLIIRTSEDITGESHEIVITAKVTDPPFQDSVKFFVNLLEFGIGQKKIVIEKLEFLRKLLEGNPECLELQELVDSAQESVDNEEVEKALKTVEAAIQACKELVSLQGKELQVPKKISTETYIAIVEILALSLIIYMIYRYYRKRHPKK